MGLRKFIATTIREYLNEQQSFNSVINDENFKNWFKNSKMVKRDGTPIIFYHGSNKSFDKFDKSMITSSTDAGWLGYGFYFYTDINEARQYGKVRSFILNIENPYFATDEDNERLAELNDIEASKEFTDNLILEGYDGVYYNGNLRGETVVFEPNQIWEIKMDTLNEDIIKYNKMNVNESSDKRKDIVDGIISDIDKNITKFKILKPGIYVNSLETAISNSNITKFYKRYYNVFFKTNKNSIPFPKDKLSTDISNSLDKLNSLIKIFEKYDHHTFQLAKIRCIHLMDLVLYDLYFGVQTNNLYETILSLEIPDETELKNVSLSAIPFLKNDGVIDNMLFSILSNNTVNFIINFDFNKYVGGKK